MYCVSISQKNSCPRSWQTHSIHVCGSSSSVRSELLMATQKRG